MSNLGRLELRVAACATATTSGKKCAATDKQVTPAASTGPRGPPFGWVNPAANDFRLSAGIAGASTPAIRTTASSTDQTSKARGAALPTRARWSAESVEPGRGA